MSDLTRAEAIKELTEHLNHWKRLLKEGICGKEYGERTIKSFEFAIDSLKNDLTIKDAYDKGYKDGQEALAFHLELCKEETEPCDSIINTIDFAVDATTGKDNYSVGMRNGMKYVKSLINGKEPDYDNCEKQEPCEDAISRDAVEEIINDIRDCISVEGYCAILERMKKLPSVNPQEPKTGHWKRISIDKYSQHAMYWYRCDRCGEDNLGNTDWCPNCGAKMETEE